MIHLLLVSDASVLCFNALKETDMKIWSTGLCSAYLFGQTLPLLTLTFSTIFFFQWNKKIFLLWSKHTPTWQGCSSTWTIKSYFDWGWINEANLVDNENVLSKGHGKGNPPVALRGVYYICHIRPLNQSVFTFICKNSLKWNHLRDM